MTVKVKDLQVRRGTTVVLDGVSFELPASSLVAIMGMSGAGKTTLLRCLAGLEPFDEGTIDLEGVGLAAGAAPGGRPRAAGLRGQIGLVFQAFELFPHLSVLENCVLAPMRVKGVARATAEAKARSLLAELGLAEKATAYPEHLSGGQKQRVAIVRALAMEPRVLLYDEPTSALDPSLRQEVHETLRRVRRTGVTQIVVTHDVDLARDVAELALILDKGKLVESGAPNDIFVTPQAEATKRLVGQGSAK